MTWIYYSLTREYRFCRVDTATLPFAIRQDIPTTQRSVFSLRSERNRRFVDRLNVYEALDQAIEISKIDTSLIPIAICGLGGTGKSQVALEFCYRNKDNFQYIFWMEADTEAALQSTFATAARMLRLPGLTASTSDAVPHMIQWLQSNDG